MLGGSICSLLAMAYRH